MKSRQKGKTSAKAEEYKDKIKAKLRSNKHADKNLQKAGGNATMQTPVLGSLGAKEWNETIANATSDSDEEESLALDFDDDEYDDDDDDEDGEDNTGAGRELSETELVELVSKRLAERNKKESSAVIAKLQARRKTQTMAKPGKDLKDPKHTTSGIGGSWTKNATAPTETYKPKVSTWGAFERPKDISKAYGGGKQVGAAVAARDLESTEKAREKTKALLQRYRETAGIDVQSEKDNAEEIEEALRICSISMQRGAYNTAVTALEKVTVHCNTNSAVGSKVFLELAMAYEAVGRTKEAITVYTSLSRCRIEEVKRNARRLLYGIEAMEIMQDLTKNSEFAREQASAVFCEATGFKTMNSNFDDFYGPWINSEGSFYKELTKNIVRTPREARQILLKAKTSGEVSRMKVVQALKTLCRSFDDEMKKSVVKIEKQEPTIFIDGVPIVVKQTKPKPKKKDKRKAVDKFELASPDQTVANMQGEWRLQLLADNQGDGVKYYDSSLSWKTLDMISKKFNFYGPSGLLSLEQTGSIDFDPNRRVLKKVGIKTSGSGSFLTSLGGKPSGPADAVRIPQQIVSVDSVLMVTRVYGRKSLSSKSSKNFFAVWRRVDSGTYSAGRK